MTSARIKVVVSVNPKKNREDELVEVASLIREALRAKGLYSGGDTGEPFHFGSSYRFIFELKEGES